MGSLKFCAIVFALTVSLSNCQQDSESASTSGDDDASTRMMSNVCKRGLVIPRCSNYRAVEQSQRGFYFDPASSTCKPYNWRCGKADFETIEDCIETCHPRNNNLPRQCYETLPKKCYRKPSKNVRKLYTFNNYQGDCQPIQTMCKSGDYENLFDSKQNCENLCKLPPRCYKRLGRFQCGPEAGPKRTFYTYNAEQGKCKSLKSTCNLGGSSTANIFTSLKECQSICDGRIDSEEDEDDNLPRVCYRDIGDYQCSDDSGPKQRYYTYRPENGKCMAFYTTCDMSFDRNNVFDTRRQCEAVCEHGDLCQLPKQTGPCKAAFRRWYYDSEKRRCLQFIYGGCGGNDNNFETAEECRRNCPKKEGNY